MASAEQKINKEEVDSAPPSARPKDDRRDRHADLRADPSADLGADLRVDHRFDHRQSPPTQENARGDRPANVDQPPAQNHAAMTPSVKLRPPDFDGRYDVEMFLTQFENVAAISGWEPMVRTLKLREALKGTAMICGRGRTELEIQQQLRERFGLTTRAARARLERFSWDTKKEIRDQAEEIDKYVTIGYGELSLTTRHEIAVDRLIRTVTDHDLRQHWMARWPRTVEEAIQEAHRFLELGRSRHSTTKVAELQVPAETKNTEVADLRQMIMALGRE